MPAVSPPATASSFVRLADVALSHAGHGEPINCRAHVGKRDQPARVVIDRARQPEVKMTACCHEPQPHRFEIQSARSSSREWSFCSRKVLVIAGFRLNLSTRTTDSPPSPRNQGPDPHYHRSFPRKRESRGENKRSHVCALGPVFAGTNGSRLRRLRPRLLVTNPRSAEPVQNSKRLFFLAIFSKILAENIGHPVRAP